MKKVIDIVSWTMKEGVIKLKDNGTFDVSEKVDVYLKKSEQYDSIVGKKVEVEINETENEDGNQTIEKIAVADKKAEPKEEPKQEEKKEEPKEEKESDLVKKDLTVAGVSVKNKGVTFVEEKDVWYTLDSTIEPKTFKDECTKKKVSVSVAPQTKGNDVIKSYVVAVEEKQPEKDEPVKGQKEYSNGKDNFYRIKELERTVRYLKEQQSASFEAQSAVNSANQTLSGMDVIHSDPKKVLDVLEKIAVKNYEVIQKLKKMEENKE